MTASDSGSRSSLGWLSVGALLTAAGAFLLLDPAARAEQFLDVAARYWPLGLLGLAVLNVVRVLLPDGSWIAPVLVGSVGLAGWFAGSLELRPVALAALPVILVGLGALALVRASATNLPGSTTAAIISRNTHLDSAVAPVIRARAYMAELRLDLTQTDWKHVETVEATAVLGRVRLALPFHVRVRLRDGGAAVHLRETGSRTAGGTYVDLHIRGALGRIDVVRS